MRKKVAAAKICAAWKKHLKARAEKKLREEVRHWHVGGRRQEAGRRRKEAVGCRQQAGGRACQQGRLP